MYHIRSTHADGTVVDFKTDKDPALLVNTFTDAGFYLVAELLGTYMMGHNNGTIVSLSVA